MLETMLIVISSLGIVLLLFVPFLFMVWLGKKEDNLPSGHSTPVPNGRRSKRKAARLLKKRGYSSMVLSERLDSMKRMPFYFGYYKSPVAKRRKRKYYSN